MRPHRARTHRRDLAAVAVVAVAGCILPATQASAANPADGPAPGRVTVSVPDVRVPRTGCTTVRMKVRVAVDGDKPWSLQSGLYVVNHPHGWRPLYGGPVTGHDDARVDLSWQICAGYPTGAWTGRVTLMVGGDSHGTTEAGDPFTVRAAKR